MTIRTRGLELVPASCSGVSMGTVAISASVFWVGSNTCRVCSRLRAECSEFEGLGEENSGWEGGRMSRRRGEEFGEISHSAVKVVLFEGEKRSRLMNASGAWPVIKNDQVKMSSLMPEECIRDCCPHFLSLFAMNKYSLDFVLPRSLLPSLFVPKHTFSSFLLAVTQTSPTSRRKADQIASGALDSVTFSLCAVRVIGQRQAKNQAVPRAMKTSREWLGKSLS